MIKGVIFKVLLNHGTFTLTDLIVYADGLVDCLGIMTLTQLETHFKTGRLTRKLPENGKLFVPFIGYIVAEKGSSSDNDNEMFIDYIKQTMQNLNLDQDVIGDTILSFREWLINPSTENFDILKVLYLKLPEKKKSLFEYGDKDPLVKLMNGRTMTRLERESCLNDYFEGEWIELND